MDWLNYHHLYYFWTVAKEGTVSAAARELHLARPTVTAQIRELEKNVGQKLFIHQGKGLVLTDFGRDVFQYAEEIFAIGHELREFVATGQKGKRKRFRVGMPDGVPKWIAFQLLKPALEMDPMPKIECVEGQLPVLLADLALHKLDLVLSDSPASPNLDVNVYSHALGECGLSILGTESLAEQFRKGFPLSLHQAPMLLPTIQTAFRRSLDRWLDSLEIFPEIIGEFADSALLKVFGQSGLGVFPVPTAIEETVKEQFGVEHIGQVPEVKDRYFAISVEKRVQHEATSMILHQARSELFDES